MIPGTYIPPDPFLPLDKPMNKDEAMRIILTCTWNHPINTIVELDEKYNKNKCEQLKDQILIRKFFLRCFNP